MVFPMSSADISPPCFRLDFGELDFGWLEIDLKIGGFLLRDRVSTVFCDPPGEWISACLDLCEQAGNPLQAPAPLEKPRAHEITLHHEPATHTLFLRDVSPWSALPEARVRIEIEYRPEGIVRDDAARAPDRSWSEVEFALIDVAREVCRAGRALFRRHGFARYHRHGMSGREFPAGALVRLHGEIYPAAELVVFPDEIALLRAEMIPASR
jgi:hypothetical protein